MTKVKFLIDNGSDSNESTDVFAYFPELVHSGNFKTCYSHIGQHSAIDTEYPKQCESANYSQYSDLLRELIGQGYNDLKIITNQEIQAHRQPTEYELKFGEGATHYRWFNISDVINKKGQIKKWFVADDKLRYYTT